MTESSEPVSPPTFLGMVICDNILQDPETKKYFLMGTTAVTFARAFPARYSKMCIYAVLTGIRERTEITLNLVYVDPESTEDTDVMTIRGVVEANDPLTVTEMTMGLRNLVFQRPGEYRFRLLSGDVLLGERKFHARPVPAKPERS
jgi:hypothetical protein